MKDFADFLKETHVQRQEMIDLAAKKITESIQSSANTPHSAYDAGISLTIFRCEMKIYHNWLMEQFACAEKAQK